MRYVTEIQPCQEVAIPKVSTRSATPNARLDTAGAARPISQRISSDIGVLSTGAPAYNAGTKRSPGCSPCKRNMPPGATPCRTVSATPQPLRPYRPSSNLISMNSPPSCRRAVTVAINMLDELVLRYSPHAAGSGIPHVEAVLNGALKPAPIRLVPVKFI